MAHVKNQLEPLLFKEFKLDRLIFEVRFNSENHYFDEISEFWENINERLPGVYKPLQEDSNATIISFENSFEIRVAPDRIAITQFYPKNKIKEFLKVTGIFFEVAANVLAINKLQRVGFRTFYAQDFANSTQVAQVLYQTPYINYPENLYLSKNGEPLLPSYSIGWRGDEMTITHRLRGRAETLSIDLPLLLTATGEFPDSFEKIYNQVILDTDVYLHNPVSPGQFFLDEWLRQAFDTIREEGAKFFGENINE